MRLFLIDSIAGALWNAFSYAVTKSNNDEKNTYWCGGCVWHRNHILFVYTCDEYMALSMYLPSEGLTTRGQSATYKTKCSSLVNFCQQEVQRVRWWSTVISHFLTLRKQYSIMLHVFTLSKNMIISMYCYWRNDNLGWIKNIGCSKIIQLCCENNNQ